MIVKNKFIFDLDGTITKIETLPLLAKELNLFEEIKILTDLTLCGKISFEQSFKLRYFILKNIPPKKILEIMETVEFDEEISNFIRENKKFCSIVTGNLDFWIEPMTKKLGCEVFSSQSSLDENKIPFLTKILNKAETVREIKKTSDKIISVGDGFNDIQMFNESDISIAYGGVHELSDKVLNAADYFFDDGKNLCSFLKNFVPR
ncbi:MAG: HAD-IB family phosphatase [Selenomonadaceae bacterium]|nr:HAD-IB family phosphatase [Selenomonadaceae bacterium]